MKAKICLLGVSLFLVECGSGDVAKGTPACVRALIEQIKNQSVWNPPAQVYRYTYRGKTVYYVPPRCCDIASTLYDESCTAVCAPDGGISGRGDGKCTDFFQSRTDETLLWKDTRK